MDDADVVLLLSILGDIRDHVAAIRWELEDGEGEGGRRRRRTEWQRTYDERTKLIEEILAEKWAALKQSCARRT